MSKVNQNYYCGGAEADRTSGPHLWQREMDEWEASPVTIALECPDHYGDPRARHEGPEGEGA